jgi:hypothetical protein
LPRSRALSDSANIFKLIRQEAKDVAKPTDTFASSEDEGVNLRAALKFVAWGAVAASAAAVVVLVAQTEPGAQRLARILSGPTRAAAESVQKVNPLAARLAETEGEAQRLSETVRRLTADRDKVVARLDALERNLDVTGSVRDNVPARDAASAPTSAAANAPAVNAPAAPPTAAGPPAPAPQQLVSLPPAAATESAAPPAAAPPPVAANAPTARPGAIMQLPTALLSPPAPATPPAAEPVNPSAVTGPATDSVATRTEFGVDLGGDRTVDALRALWTSLRAGRHASLLAGLRPLVAIRESGKPGAVEFRLVVGPVVNAGAAARLCGTLAAAGLACQPAVFDGQRLALR